MCTCPQPLLFCEHALAKSPSPNAGPPATAPDPVATAATAAADIMASAPETIEIMDDLPGGGRIMRELMCAHMAAGGQVPQQAAGAAGGGKQGRT